MRFRHLSMKKVISGKYWMQLAILGALWLLIDQYEIFQYLRLPELMPIVFGVFAVNHWLSEKWQLHFQNLVFVGSVIILFGVIPGAYLLALLGLYIGLLCSPIPFRLKTTAIVLIAGLVLYSWRNWSLPLEFVSVLPIFGSIVMFRTIIFLFDQSYGLKYGPVKDVSYFLILPNLLFPVFPIIDYKTFNKSRNKGEIAFARGLQLIFRGITHLLFFRVIYHFWIPSPGAIIDAVSALQYIATSYLGVVKLSGMFHIVIGILCLFGYNLPDIFHNYFLADGFSDLWKRINSYWRDFILKVFYYPFYLKIKSKQFTLTLVITVLVSFVLNWFMHSYQWLWILGNFPVTIIDLIFWGSFGVLVAMSAFWQRTQSLKKSLTGKQTFFKSFLRSVRILLVFSTMAVLWSLWQVPSLQVFIRLFELIADNITHQWLPISLSILAILTTLSIYLHLDATKSKVTEVVGSRRFNLGGNLLLIFLFIVLLYVPFRDRVSREIGVNLHLLAGQSINDGDKSRQFDGYYENLTSGITDMLSESRILETKKVTRQALKQLSTEYPLAFTLEPNLEVDYRGGIFSTNSWGFRDDEYSIEKQSGVHRIAIMGSSDELGQAINDEYVFDKLLEKKLTMNGHGHVEIINFSMPGSSVIPSVYRAEYVNEQFSPDTFLFFIHAPEWNRLLIRLSMIISLENDLPVKLDSLLSDLKIDRGGNRTEIYEELKPHQERIVEFALWELIELKKIEKEILVVLMPNSSKKLKRDILDAGQILNDNGIQTISLDGIYEGKAKKEIIVSEADHHPNESAHELIAEKLFEAIVNQEISEGWK